MVEQAGSAALLRVVPAATKHLAAVAEIYGDAALSSVATFDLEPQPLSYWSDVLARAEPGHFLVALEHGRVEDDGEEQDGRVLGYALAGAFRPRAAYARTRETSVYLRESARGRGTGRALYAALLARLRQDGVHLAVAVVAQPNPASNALHERLGFTLVGTLDEVGHKFGRYVSTRWYQLRLDHRPRP